ncbi:MAG: hypothetical protein HY901_15295 [Deltaproteobacteria bacterium]|nr:hypothetical protein [Deltaproteobacteria bacterium]
MANSPKAGGAAATEEGPLAIRDGPLELGSLDLEAWLPRPAAPSGPRQASTSAPLSSSPAASEALFAVAIEAWRMKARVVRLKDLLSAKELRALEISVTKMEEALLGAGVQLDDPQGRPFHEGDPLEVLLFEPSPGLARATVLQTVKPAILMAGKLVRRAEVVVGTPGEAAAKASDASTGKEEDPS